METLQSIENIDRMNPEELDALPFGGIRLDKDGKILSYNMTESKLTGRDPKRVIGRNFFTDVAPCTNMRRLPGRFREGWRRGDAHHLSVSLRL
ncbi:MAG TPA: PAS domain-containing protein [Thermoanaerobaculia bacterium]|nr:PAS domain-containing protein [Thermoanaerobaculia bacterium]